jgi:hypothetical protein
MIACASGKKEASTLEQTRGPLIYALLEYPFFVLYPVNPATTARYRQAFKTSRAKDDPSDAQICLELLLHHREKLTPWLPEDAQTRELSCLLQHRRTAVDLRTLLSNMLRATRSRVIIPRPLELAGQDLFAPLGCQFLLKWPSLQELQKARKESVRKFYYAHNCRRMDVVPRLIPKIFEIGGDAEIAAAHELKSRIHRCLLVVLFNFAKAHGWLGLYSKPPRTRSPLQGQGARRCDLHTAGRRAC